MAAITCAQTFGKQGLLLAPMPADRFCSGHMVWVQQEGDVRDCLSVHATFTEYGDGGKRFRFLEAVRSFAPSAAPTCGDPAVPGLQLCGGVQLCGGPAEPGAPAVRGSS